MNKLKSPADNIVLYPSYACPISKMNVIILDFFSIQTNE